MIGKTLVFEAIKAGEAKHNEKLDITAERVLQEIAAVAFANFADYVKDGDIQEPDKLDRANARVVKGFKKKTRTTKFDGEVTTEVSTEITLHDKMKALEALAKRLGLDKPDKDTDSDSGNINTLLDAINKSI